MSVAGRLRAMLSDGCAHCCRTVARTVAGLLRTPSPDGCVQYSRAVVDGAEYYGKRSWKTDCAVRAEGDVMPYSDDASQQRDDSADTQATQAYNPFAETMAGEEMPIAATSAPAPATTQPMQEAPTQAMSPLPQQSIPTQQFAAAQATQATRPLQSAQTAQATQTTQTTQPLQDMAMQQLDDPYAGRRMATQSMNFSSRPSVLPRSASEDALMGATGVVGAPIGSAQARDAAETQVMQPTISVPPTMPMTAGQTQTIAYGQNPYAAGHPGLCGRRGFRVDGERPGLRHADFRHHAARFG